MYFPDVDMRTQAEPRETLKERIAREDDRLRAEALARLAKAIALYKSELVTIGDLTVRKPPCEP